MTPEQEWIEDAKRICGSNYAYVKACGGYAIFVKKVTDKFVAIKPHRGKRRRIKIENWAKYCERFELMGVKFE